MVRSIGVLVLLAGCKQVFGLSEPAKVDAAATTDAVDAYIPDAGACTGASAECISDVLRTCADASSLPVDTTCAWGCGGATPHCEQLVPAGGAVTAGDLDSSANLSDVTFSGTVYIDTGNGAIGLAPGSGSIRQAGTGVISGIDYRVAGNVAVFRFKSLRITGGTVAPLGDHALALVSIDAMTVGGAITLLAPCVSGGGGGPGQGGSLGGFAGGLAAMSASGSGAGAGGSGGAGGNGGGHGGTGGRGGANALTNVGPIFGDDVITTLVGGGGGGGGSGGRGGNGGGAVQLVSNASIAITGSINAGGCGGTSSGANSNGGGGAGAGGTILVEAPTVTIDGKLAVNGGGGGGVGQSGTGANGGIDRTAAAGDTGSIANGGPGAAGATPDGGDGTINTSRGGGGGGGIGRIRIDTRSGAASISNQAVLSPAPSDPSSTCTVGAANVQ